MPSIFKSKKSQMPGKNALTKKTAWELLDAADQITVAKGKKNLLF